MAGSRTGTPSVIRHARKICKIVSTYGAGNLATVATPEFASAVTALVIACHAFAALDDQPGQVDSTVPIRAGEDQD